MFLVLSAALAQEEGTLPWIGSSGVDGFDWGTDDMPLDAVPRPKDLVLPDSAFIGARRQDRPDDLELKAPPGERRFLRYVHGVLVDAWIASERPLDPGILTGYAKPTWTGTVLGPAEDGFYAYGTASSWNVGTRTVLHWHDSGARLDVVASRATPTPQYGIGRPEPLQARGDTRPSATFSGDLKRPSKPYQGLVASCFDQSRKPVNATIVLKLDARGEPSRIRVNADQPALDLDDCVAGALLAFRGAPNFCGTLEMSRFR